MFHNWESLSWHSALVFSLGDCPLESEPSPTSAGAYGEVTGCDAGGQEVGMCSTRGGSQGMYIRFTSANKTEPTLTLKPRGEIQKQGYQWPQKGHVAAKNFKKTPFMVDRLHKTKKTVMAEMGFIVFY